MVGSVRMASETVDASFEMGVVPMDWLGACIYIGTQHVHLYRCMYKRNSGKCECSNSRGISLLCLD